MAQIPLVSGGSQPVFAIDTLNGPQLAANVAYTPAGTPVMIMGPKLDFFGVGNCPSSISNQAEVNGAIQQILQQIQQTSTVAFYQAGNTQISLAVYPTGAWSNTNSTSGSLTAPANLVAALNTATGYANVSGTQAATFNTYVDYE